MERVDGEDMSAEGLVELIVTKAEEELWLWGGFSW